MRIVFLEFDGKVTVGCVGDNVPVGMANSVWQADARRGEVVAEVSQPTYDCPDGPLITDERSRFFEEIFSLGRQYERQQQERVKLQAIDDSKKNQENALEIEEEYRRLHPEGDLA